MKHLKLVVVIGVTVAGVMVTGIVGAVAYGKYQTDVAIKHYQSEISLQKKNFDSNNTDAAKLKALDTLELNYKKYLAKDRKLGIANKFSAEINDMKGYFTKINNESITEGNIPDINNSSNVAGITNAINKFNSILVNVKSETPAVYTQQQADQTNAQINTLVMTYSNRVKAIQDAAAQAAAAQEAQSNQSSGNSSTTSKSDGKDGNSGTSSSKRSTYTTGSNKTSSQSNTKSNSTTSKSGTSGGRTSNHTSGSKSGTYDGSYYRGWSCNPDGSVVSGSEITKYPDGTITGQDGSFNANDW